MLFTNKFTFIYLLFLLSMAMVSCQQVTIVVKDIPRNTPKGAVLFVTGNFNVFDPGDQSYTLKRQKDSTYVITMPRGKGKISYKFTRGDWTTQERDGCGNEQPYRWLVYGESDTVYTEILSWEDLGPVECDLVTFVVKPPDNTPAEDQIYIAGSFNDWNPENGRYRLNKTKDGRYTIQLPKQSGTIEYKFTRGGWHREEVNEVGEAIPNRQFTYGRADSVFIDIPGWRDIEEGANPFVTFMVQAPQNTPPGEQIYIVGTFNNWYPRDGNYLLKRVNKNLYSITLPAREDYIEYKFTRGGWDKEEVDEAGNKISNRRFLYGRTDTVYVSIPGWLDLPQASAQ